MDQLGEDTYRREIDLDDFTIAQNYAKYILLMWKYRAWRNSRAHYRTSDQLRILGVGFMLVHATAAIAVLGFSSLDSFFSESELWKLFVALAGLVAVLVAIIQLLMRHESRSQQHKLAAGDFSNLQRKIERYLGMPHYRMGVVHNINRELNFVTKLYPAVPMRIWRKKDPHDLEIDQLIKDLESKLDGIVKDQAFGESATADNTPNPGVG